MGGLGTYVPGETYLKGEFDPETSTYIPHKICPGCAATWHPATVIGYVTGTRIFHKFDPIPGFYMNGLIYNHQLTSPAMVYDTEGGCTSTPFTEKDDSIGPIGNLHTFLCTKYGVKTNKWSAPVNYYSYTNSMNPAPCAEAAVASAMQYLKQTTTIDFSDVEEAFKWTPYESMEQCVYTYMATVEAYGKTYLTSALTGQNEIRDIDFWLSFYTMWGLWWIHSAYPNYPIGEAESSSLTYAAPTFSKSDTIDLEAIAKDILTRA